MRPERPPEPEGGSLIDDQAPAVERFVVDEERVDQRLDQAIAELAGATRSQVGRWVKAGRVRVDGACITRPARRVHMGERLELERPEPEVWDVEPEPIPIDVVFEDAHLVVVDKAAGMVVHPAPGHRRGTLVNALLHRCTDLAGVGGALRPGIVHRLDQGTTGILVVAKDDATHQGLARQFEDHSIERLYLAVTRGAPRAESGRVDRPIGRHPSDRKRMSVRARSGRDAITRWEVLERFPTSHHAFVAVRPAFVPPVIPAHPQAVPGSRCIEPQMTVGVVAPIQKTGDRLRLDDLGSIMKRRGPGRIRQRGP
jgi:23S rRNA pseudouridine1911/1915/1917 synthase